MKRGETNRNCADDCPRRMLGQIGSRQKNDICGSGLKGAEPIFPARPGCINVYDGSFYCTNCGNGICETIQGENYYNCLDCSS